MEIYTPAAMVDHIIPIDEKNWKELFLNVSNLQPLCDNCHKFKTNRGRRHDSCSELSIDEILGL